jgi:DNA polymerase-3 subunit alpha
MADPRFVHLHLHTDYSLLDGACGIEELVDEAARREMPAVAVTDHGNLFAAEKFYHIASTRGVKPIIGCEVYVAKGSRLDRGNSEGTGREAGADSGQRGSNHLVLLCQNETGYRNLIKLVTSGFLEGFYYRPRIDYDILSQHSSGLIALSACLRGAVTENIVREQYDAARDSAYKLQDIFGKGNFFLEVQDQGLEIEQRVNKDLVRLGRETGIPLVATNDCHYLTQEDARAQEVMLCIQTGTTMSDGSRMKFATDQFFFKTAQQMAEVFREIPEAVTRTVEIAGRCNVKIEPVRNAFPEFRVPEGHTLDSYFEKIVREGFAERLPRLAAQAAEGRLRVPLADYETRLTNEIQMIQQMHYAGYFLIVWDFIRYAKAQEVPVGPGRGSAAGSLVGYSMRITDVDPMQYGLYFERFLNPERISLPDIDIDFCMRRRGEIIDYVTQKYGRANVAQIITFGTMAAKAAIKDVGRALDVPYGEVDKLAKQIPAQLNITLEDSQKQSSQLRAMLEGDEKYRELFEIAKRLEGLVRHPSTHAAGVVISPGPLTDFVPLYKTNRDEITTQYDMGGLERLGLLKMDFLGLTTLTVLHDTAALIRANRGVELDLAAIPLDDERTYQLFARADTTAIFQFESHGMRDILRRYQPTRIEDLTALNALYRPGPIQGGMIDEFIARKLGKKKVTYDLPELKEILEETWGVMVYQEQVMRIASRLAGFSMGEADILRRAMGKKKKEEMAAQREKFLTGCAANKVPAKKAERIFELMNEFAAYGFVKAHSCAYALLAYQTAYLKTHYPVEFMAALLTSETGNTEKAVKYIHEARGMGITVMPPDVNSSDVDFTPLGDAIRFGLRAIKNVGETAVKSILQARAELGQFRSLYQFCDAVDMRLLNRRVLESLIKAGALDSLGAARAQMLAAIDHAIDRAQRRQREKTSGQNALFGGGAATATAPAEEPLPEIDEWPEHERLAAEYATLGFYISGHPLSKHAARLKEIGAIDLATLEGRQDGEEVTVAGIVIAVRPMRSKKGDRWGIVSLQDMTGGAEVLMFPEAFGRLEGILKSSEALLVKARVKVEDAGTRLIGMEARAIENGAARKQLLRVRVDLNVMDEFTLDRLRELFVSKPGTCPVAFDLLSPDGSVATLRAQQRVKPDEALLQAVRQLCEADAVSLEGGV